MKFIHVLNESINVDKINIYCEIQKEQRNNRLLLNVIINNKKEYLIANNEIILANRLYKVISEYIENNNGKLISNKQYVITTFIDFFKNFNDNYYNKNKELSEPINDFMFQLKKDNKNKWEFMIDKIKILDPSERESI